MTSSRAVQEVLPLFILKTVRTPRRPRSVLMVWSLMDAGSEWISLSPKELTLQLLESTWDAPHMVVVAVVEEEEEAAAAEVVEAVVHHAVSLGTTTGDMTEDTIEVMIATMIATKSESTDRTDADLRLRITAEVTAHDLGPIRHVTTRQLGQYYVLVGFFCCCFFFHYFYFLVFFFHFDQTGCECDCVKETFACTHVSES